MAEHFQSSGAGLHAAAQSQSPMLAAALEYAANGYPIFPCFPTGKAAKRPCTPHGFHDATTDLEEIKKWWTLWPRALIAMPTGKASRRIVIDIDVDASKNKDGEKSLINLLKAQGENLPATLTARTPRGGRHLYFEYPDVEIPSRTGCPAESIDVRADGGYIIAPPSISSIGQYCWENVMAEVAPMPEWLLQLIQSNRVRLEVSAGPIEEMGAPSPFEYPNETKIRSALKAIPASDRETWLDVGFALKSHFGDNGWKLFDEWSKTAPESYDEQKNRDQWQTFTVDGGINIGTIFYLAKNYGWQQTLTRSNTGTNAEYLGKVEDSWEQRLTEIDNLASKLKERKYSPAARPLEPSPRYFLGKIPICTPGNLTTISAQAKAGKSAVVNAMIASIFRKSGADCLGFSSTNPKGYAILHLDTEQSKFDHWQGIRQAIRRAEVEEAPPHLLSYCLTGLSFVEIRAAIRFLLEKARADFNGVHSLFIDGIGDVVNNVNDPIESGAFVADLQSLVTEFDCSIINVIHVNPGSDYKTRGHLGSQLERKSETNLRLEKDKDGSTVIWSDKNRHAPIPRSTAPRFAWNDEAKMHIAVHTQSLTNTQSTIAGLHGLASAIFEAAGKQFLRHGKFIELLENKANCARSTAKRRLDKMIRAHVINREPNGVYCLKQADDHNHGGDVPGRDHPRLDSGQTRGGSNVLTAS